MANQEHLEILKSGVKKWNEFRMKNPGIIIDLSKAYLSKADLYNVNLSEADLPEANLFGADLRWADLSEADLRRADLSKADLRRADLSEAYLFEANLSEANLFEADLFEADLRCADLSEAYLRRANLSEANLFGADLFGADLFEADLPDYKICPTYGEFHCWKKGRDEDIIKLRIPAFSRRTSSLIGRKCRSEYAFVIEIKDENGKIKKESTGSIRPELRYIVGKYVKADNYDNNPKTECSDGIHFFMTYEEALKY